MENELQLAADELIVSKTDLQGTITYCNRVFMRITGYSAADVLGRPHTVIRHPGMPRGVFRHMWETIEQGNEYYGFVKNRTSGNDAYWCFSVVTPDYDSKGRRRGYFAVQRRARREAIASITPIYDQMLAVERRCPKAEAPAASLRWLRDHLAEQDTEYEPFIIMLQRGETI
ncbi:MAG TPA: PAS domain S-box protein [Desulfobulbus sp.]|nr:PAS domain S-box protein [Desulfobulbus sp.]